VRRTNTTYGRALRQSDANSNGHDNADWYCYRDSYSYSYIYIYIYSYTYGNINTYRYRYSPTHANAKI
jgi:hypothetical protein